MSQSPYQTPPDIIASLIMRGVIAKARMSSLAFCIDLRAKQRLAEKQVLDEEKRERCAHIRNITTGMLWGLAISAAVYTPLVLTLMK